MSSEESIPTDASTVHRSPEDIARVASSNAVAGSETDGALVQADIDQIAQANTVIRGSSRIEKVGDRIDARAGTPAAVAKVLLGKKLNHFLLNELIGGGGMGAVFRAHDEHLDRTVAIKVIPFVGEDPDLQRRFRNEAQSAAKLDHPRIARVYDVGHYDDWHYIVFEYIEGTNIRDRVHTKGVMSVDEAVFYTSHLADALQHASDRGIVHRDIKPSNVLIGAGGKVKLVDMGLARSDNLDLSHDVTASGVTLGTFDYISPEQAHDPRVADLRSDIYSLGCTLYFMLTGSPPYPGGTMLQKLLSHGNAPPPDVRELRPEVSDNLVAVLEKMLAKKPIDRYQTATDLIADLREVAFRDGLNRSQTLSPVAVAQPNPMLMWLEKHIPWVVAVGLLIGSAGWLHLESAATRQDVVVPKTAMRPVTDPGSTAQDNDPSASLRQPTSSEAVVGPTEKEPAVAESTISPAPLDGNGGFAVEPEMPETTALNPPMIEGFSAAQDNVSIEPLGSDVPSVVRVVESEVSGFPELQYGDNRDEEGRAIAPSLGRALEIAAEFGISSIEIAVPVLRSEPLRIESDDLKIRSVVGGSVIQFQSADSVMMERSKMFSIGSHPIEFDGLHFVWKVPASDIDGGALFEVNDGQQMELNNCSVTIDNPTLREEVYAFEVITSPDRLRRADDSEASLIPDTFPRVSIDMKNVIVRGQMTMLHMDYAAELLLSWSNGLLAITEHMIDTAGALKQPPASAGPIQISLTRVTAHAAGGIVQMRMGVSGPYPVSIDRFARNCVFFVKPGKPHFLFSENVPLEDLPPLLQLRGVANAYVVDPALADPMLMMVGFDDETEVTRMNDLLTATPDWASDTSPLWAVNWVQTPLTTRPTSQRTPIDYRQQGVASAGFDEKRLPSEGLVDRQGAPPANVRELPQNAVNLDEF
ncbi:MAG: serine/threonine protein kinase [Rubripirellula sp.]